MPGLRDEERALKRAMDARLGRELTLWLATTSADGRPHLVPVWFVWFDDKLYVCVTTDSQEMANMQTNRHAAVAAPDTADVLIVEGAVNFPRGETIDRVAQYFFDKYGWDMMEDDEYDWRLVEIAPSEVLAWNTDE